MKHVLLDTGPVVAFLNRKDTHHQWAVSKLSVCHPPLLTCESVLSESAFLLHQLPGGTKKLADLLARGLITVPFRLQEELETVLSLLTKYLDVGISLADACLIRMSEIYSNSVVLTTDSDFKIYRRNGRQIIPVSAP